MKNELVILLHGIFRTSRSMSGLAKFLSRRGFKVLNINYPSTKFPIEELVSIIDKEIKSCRIEQYSRVHFVGFSMGGLLARAYLNQHKVSHLGKVVFIGTPNNGSEVADFLKNNLFYQKVFGPAGQQLITDQSDFNHMLGLPYYEFGVIAGNIPLGIFASAIIGKPNDGKVSIESTKLPGMKDHIVLRATHLLMPGNRNVWKQALYFLENSHFHR